MNKFFYDEDLAMVYKISPVVATLIEKEGKGVPAEILVHANVKMTNFKREKVRRTISEIYPSSEYGLDLAKKIFEDKVLARLVGKATPIEQDEYDRIKRRLEPVNHSSCAT